jgi:rsbT co-antagonist protein RsbR
MIDADFHRFIVDTSPDALSCHTEAGAFVFTSPAWAGLLGCSVAELHGRTLEDLALPEDAAAVTQSREEALRTLQATTVRYRALHRDQRTLWVETTLRAAPFGGSSGAEAPRLMASSRDVTARVLAEEEARARLERAELAEEHRDNLTALMPGLVWYGPVSPDLTRYHLTYMSDYLIRVTGYSPQEWLETPGFWRQILHPEDRTRVIMAAERVLPDGEAYPAYRVFTKDGRAIWLQTYMRVQRDAAGVPVRRHGVTLDVTTYKETEREIEKLLAHQTLLKERIDELISSIPGIVWESWPPDGRGNSIDEETGERRANFCSDYMEVLTGYTPKEWAALPNAWITMMPPEDREDIRQKVIRLTAIGGGSIQHRVITKDRREIWLDNHLVMGKDADGVVTWIRGVALDITERRVAEQERERLQVQVELQAERLLELSTPLIPVSDKIMVMPLIGTIDQMRSDHIMVALLRGVSAAKAEVVIIDVTGVPELDATSADALILTAGAAQLLGTRVVLTGIRPEVAQTLISLGLDLGKIATRRDLATAFAELTGGRLSGSGAGRRAEAMTASRG